MREFVVSANLRNTVWSFYIGKLQSPPICAELPQQLRRQMSKSWLAKFPTLLWKKQAWEKKFPECKIRGRREASAADLHGKGLAQKGTLFHRHQYHTLSCYIKSPTKGGNVKSKAPEGVPTCFHWSRLCVLLAFTGFHRFIFLHADFSPPLYIYIYIYILVCIIYLLFSISPK